MVFESRFAGRPNHEHDDPRALQRAGGSLLAVCALLMVAGLGARVELPSLLVSGPTEIRRSNEKVPRLLKNCGNDSCYEASG